METYGGRTFLGGTQNERGGAEKKKGERFGGQERKAIGF